MWEPQAARLGLHYVAQPYTEDLGSVLHRHPFRNLVAVQVFSMVEDAATWLRDCQRQTI